MSVRHPGDVHVDTIVVIASPLGSLSWWAAPDPVVDSVRLVEIDVDDGPPYGATWLARAAQALHTTRPAGALLFVGHGMAGPMLPAVARTQRAAKRRVAGYVFVDATLPRPGRPSHLDLLRAADPSTADQAHRHLHGSTDAWPPDSAHPGNHEFWTSPLPPTADWPDALCVYIRSTADPPPGTGDTHFWARSAKARGWPVYVDADVTVAVTSVLQTG